jgi:GH25 family lysozyme M1 (1,4-beta-N-acetylmuramidase)
MPSRAIDWTRFDSNIDFVYIGPQVGTPAVFLTAWNGLRAHKIRRGACLVFYAGREPVQQADAFAAAVRIEPDDLPPCVVVEKQPGDAKLVPAEIGRRLRICLERLAQKTGRRPVLCTRYDYWKPEFGDFSAYPLGFVPGNVRAAKLALPGTWKSWTLWLDTFDREVAGVGFVDVYYFNGGRAALDQFVAQSRVAS